MTTVNFQNDTYTHRTSGTILLFQKKIPIYPTVRDNWTKWAVKLDRANNHWIKPQFKRECIFTNTLFEYNMLRFNRIGLHAMYQAHGV